MVVNWHNYNESLVRRGEVVLDFDVIDSWHNELDKMNDGKEGASYRYPNSFVQLLGYMRVYFHLPYRQTEGVVRAYTGSRVQSIPDYSTINIRVNKLDIKINKRIGNDIVIVLDSTGIKVTNREERVATSQMEYKKRIPQDTYVAVDVKKKKKIVSLEVTTEEVHDGMMLKKLIENAAENNDVKRVIADGAYDNKENFRYLSDNGIEAAIKVRKNSFADKLTHCYPRNIVVRQQLKNFEKWKDSVSYGYRWIVAETVFSSIKRTFGEYVSARKYSNMVKEMMLKASLYNTFITRK